MDKKIAEYLEGRGYYNIPNDAGNDIRVFYRVESRLAAVVILIDARKIILSRNNFQKLKNDVGGMFASKGYDNIQIFSIFIVSNTIVGKNLTAEEEYSWLVDTGSGRLIIYEHQLIDFDGLRDGLEKLVESEPPEGGFREEKLTIQKAFADNFIHNEARITIGLILINILVFVALSLGGNTLDAAYMIDHGAMYPSYVIYNNEYYRLFTCMFMHFGVEHLASNMLSLFIFGEKVEKAIGKVKFIILYLMSGLLAGGVSLMTSYMLGLERACAGASGAIFGVIGALFVIIIKDKNRFRELTAARVALMIGYSLFAGITGGGVDNSAHIGGVIAGLVLGAILFRKKKTEMKGNES
ncbi:rhomboid family intramembrane serine protease [Lachnospiraceae bacterium C1.1]|nr:rhomboid family intramembrane serine protease [Lachnospiraceae bacterium C1.1]